MAKKSVVNLNVLPNEPLDGRGRVYIHLFVIDPAGPFVEPHVLHPCRDEQGEVIPQQVEARPTRGRLACDPKRLVAPRRERDGSLTITMRTDDPRAATCPKCLASADYARLMDTIAQIEASR